MQNHEMRFRVCHWFFCNKCGIVNLNNKETHKTLEKKCPGSTEDKEKIKVRLGK